MTESWSTDPKGFAGHTLPDGRRVEVGRSPNGNAPGVGGMAVASPSMWLRVDGGPWHQISRDVGFMRVLVVAQDPAWVDAFIAESLRWEAQRPPPSPPPPNYTFEGKHGVYTVYLNFKDGGHVRSEKGVVIAHFTWNRAKGKMVYLKAQEGTGGKLPVGLAEFLDNLMKTVED